MRLGLCVIFKVFLFVCCCFSCVFVLFVFGLRVLFCVVVVLCCCVSCLYSCWRVLVCVF